METKEIKLILKLLGEEGYQAKVSSIKPTSKSPITECNRICSQLCDQKLIEITESEITKIKITASGKALLKINPSDLPISQKELKILQSCAEGSVFLTDIDVSSKTKLTQSLVERGFITAVQVKPKQVALSETGKTFLLNNFSPSGTNSVLSLNMLSNYLTFLRNHQSIVAAEIPQKTNNKPKDKLADEEILELIIQLDKEYNTNNYLPIFYLREQLQPSCKREELDHVLYRLEGNDKIQLSSLTETEGYTPEQLKAGISQHIGGPLFFIQVTH